MLRENKNITKKQPIVIKLGGSLYPHAASVTQAIKESQRPCLIVGGGGAGADALRAQDLDDDAAHWMAILAMEQYGWYLSSFGIPVVEPSDSIAIPTDQRICLPYYFLYKTDPLPHSWDVTSDSISLFIADRLNLPLLILKSIDRIRINAKETDIITQPGQTDDLDAYFLSYACSLSVQVTIINGQDPQRIKMALDGVKVPGTVIKSNKYI